MKKISLMLFICFGFTMYACKTLESFLEEESHNIIGVDNLTRKKEFVTYVNQDLERKIKEKFPTIDRRFDKSKGLYINITYLIVSDVKKYILWHDYKIMELSDNITEADRIFCREIIYFLYAEIQPKFYPPLWRNKANKNEFRVHKQPTYGYIIINFNEGEMEVEYQL